MFHPADFPVADVPLTGGRGQSAFQIGGTLTPGTPLFGPTPWTSTNEFLPDGRRSIAGIPLAARSPYEMWASAFHYGFTNQLRGMSLHEDGSGVPQEGGDMVDSRGAPAIQIGQDSVDSCSGLGTEDDGTIRFDKSPIADIERPLEVESIDLHIHENSIYHHTQAFEVTQRKQNPCLVIRRGQEFFLTIKFYRNFDPISDQVKLIFELGDLPTESKGTRATLDCQQGHPSSKFKGWDVMTAGCMGNQINLQICTPADLVVGAWKMKVLTIFTRKEGFALESVCPLHNVFVLFNPWCEEDSVFMENAEEREEYVLNDVGIIWKGCHYNKQPVTWTYGQVNATNENGVIMANWSHIFAAGTPPAAWTGTAPILREYATFGRPAKFAQCWVLAGIMTTVMRCLGIPCRAVTNYSSAHDMDNSSTINIHFSESTGKVQRDYNSDTIWGFHVWNDCWMARPDLPDGFDGWQVVDCTPQNKYDGLARVGPAPVVALRDGHVGCSFDVGSIYTELNAEKSYWILDERKARLSNVNCHQVGLSLITKAPLKNEALDVTGLYKNKHATSIKRKVTMDALLQMRSTSRSSSSSRSFSTPDEPVDVLLSVDIEKGCCPLIGQDFSLGVNLTNVSMETRTVKLFIRIHAALYTGGIGRSVKSECETHVIQPEKTKTIAVHVLARQYLEKMLDQGFFVVSIFGTCAESGQTIAYTDGWTLKFPEISVKVENEILVNQPTKVTFSFINPLPTFLTKCRFIAEGPGILYPKLAACREVAPNCWVSATIEVKPWQIGQRTMAVRFISDEIKDIHGSCTVQVINKNA